MATALKFWIRTAIWAIVLAGIFTLLSLISGGGADAIARIPGWLGLGLALGTYPAGIAVSEAVVGGEGMDLSAIVKMKAAALAVCAIFLVLAGFVGPRVQRSMTTDGAVAESREMTLFELRTAIREAGEMIDPDHRLEPSTIDDWFEVNALMWDFFVRLSGALLPFLFAWIGIAAGYWTRLTPLVQLRTPQLLGLGFILVVSTYLSNENSFEWIVVQAAGPVPFAGLFSLIVPTLLMIGLNWPLGILKWRQGITR